MKRMANNTRHSSPGGNPPSGAGALFRHTLLGVAFALGAAFLLLLLGSALCLRAENPLSLTAPVGGIILYLCAALSGWFGARIHQRQILLCGLIGGGFLILFFGIAAWCIPTQEAPRFSFPLTWLLRGLILPCACLGSLLGGQGKKHRRRRH